MLLIVAPVHFIAATAAPLAKRLEKLGYPTKIIPVVDNNAVQWQVLAAGEFTTQDDARAARGRWTRGLGTTQPLTLIVLPPPPKKKPG